MPGKTKKDIYIGKSMAELNKRVDNSDNKANPRVIANSATRIILEADKAYKLQDEERAYILYMRYALMWRLVKGSSEYKKDQKFYDDLLGKKAIKRALDHAEELSTSLQSRSNFRDSKDQVPLRKFSTLPCMKDMPLTSAAEGKKIKGVTDAYVKANRS